MDFFERAHVVKKDLLRKNSKSENVVKQQLKQMLRGYKNNDTELIKTSEAVFNPNKLYEDSSSVSGFSDLNITNSSNEAEGMDDIENSDSEDMSCGDDEVSLDNTSSSLNISNVSSIDDFANFTESGGKIETFPDVTSQDTDIVSDDIENISTISSLAETQSEIETNGSDFDPDGELALKILEKLGSKISMKANGKKSKLVSENLSNPSKIKYEEGLEENDCEEENSKDDLSSDHVRSTVNDDVSDSNLSFGDSSSSAVIRVVATEMLEQSLGDVVGQYKHPTIKNLPSDIQNISAHNTDLFCTKDVSLEDIQIQEEVGSLTPEYDNNDTIDDFNLTNTCDTTEPLNDSTSAYKNTFQWEETSEKDYSKDVVDNFVSSVNIYYGKKNIILVLRHPAELYIHGKVTVKTLGGTLNLLGYTLQDKPCDVYAPKYNYAQCIKTIENENTYFGLFSKLTLEGLPVLDAEEIVTGLGEYDAILSLRKLNNIKMDFVENNMTGTDLFSRPSKHVDNCLKKACDILKCSLYLSRPWKAFDEVSNWNKAVECGLNKQSRGIICGGKGVGKSTFLRYIVNKLLSRESSILVIDLDPGQAEFTVAGNISATIVDKPLLGPSFTHLKTPEMMLNLGLINTMDNPRRYAAAVSDLISYCHNNEKLKSMAWVINTMGMTNDIGLKFLVLIILHVQPTYLLQMDSENSKKRFGLYLDCYAVKKLYENYLNDSWFKNLNCPTDLNYSFSIASRSDTGKNNFSLPPRDERYLNFLAYFGEIVTNRQKDVLLNIVPYEVNLKGMHIGLNVKLTKNAVAKVINGKIIALCQLTDEDNNAKVFTLKDKAILCHGHGLVRGVDMERQMVYINTPLAMDKLSKVNTLVYADWVPELRGQEKQLPDGTTVPYRTSTTYQKRQLMFTPRRRFNPLQLIKLSRNS